MTCKHTVGREDSLCVKVLRVLLVADQLVTYIKTTLLNGSIDRPRNIHDMNTPVVVPFSQANRSRVSSLYRRSLKLARDWLVQRESWRRESMNIRQRFEQNMAVQNPRLLGEIFDKTERELLNYKHPDPYIGMPLSHLLLRFRREPLLTETRTVPTAPGGSKWERNTPPVIAQREVVTHETQ